MRRFKNERREGLEWKRSCVWCETSDELGSEGEDLVEVERGVEGLWEGRLLEGSPDVRGVTGFNGQDGAGDREIGFINDGGGGTEVSGDTDSFEDRCETDECLRILWCAEVVLGFGDWSCMSGSESTGESGDMDLLVVSM